jgi:streptomycin 6-kinase
MTNMRCCLVRSTPSALECGRYIDRVARVNPTVEARLADLGVIGSAWLVDLDRTLAELTWEWSCTIGDSIDGGSGSFVAEATDRQGRPAIVKISIPDGAEGYAGFARQLQAHELGRGRFVEVFEASPHHLAVLFERLGPSLDTFGYSVEHQIDNIGSTLRSVWRSVPDTCTLPTGQEQARGLRDFILDYSTRLQHPCSSQVIARALTYIENRISAFDRSISVLVHGDAHPGNVLASGSGSGSHEVDFKLIDPEGLISEPAHDLAIPLRDWSSELLAGDPISLGRAWAERLGQCAGVDPQAVWEWAFIERVSTGLLLKHLGDPESAAVLEVAEHWVTSSA